MRGLVGVGVPWFAIVGCGYPQPADPSPTDLSIVIPAAGATITHHEPIELAINLHDADAASFAIQIDGVPVDERPIPSTSARLCEDCNYQLSWPSLEAREGVHEITVLALDAGGSVIAAGSVSLVFNDTPELRAVAPAALDLLGVGQGLRPIQ